jgi:hypothetical protein
MGWLDSGEDISHLLRGNTYSVDTPLAATGPEPAFELMFLIVICGILFACFAAGVMYAWESRFALADKALAILAEAVRLKRRLAMATKNFRARIEEEVAKKEETASETTSKNTVPAEVPY